MKIDEAIAHARELAKNKRADADWRWTHGRLDSDDLINCAEEHEQLAEWLEELKEYKLKEFQCHLAREEGVTIGYEKCIDDFAEKLKNHYQYYDIDLCLQDNEHLSYTNSILALESYIDEIAQQLKEGVNNESDC